MKKKKTKKLKFFGLSVIASLLVGGLYLSSSEEDEFSSENEFSSKDINITESKRKVIKKTIESDEIDVYKASEEQRVKDKLNQNPDSSHLSALPFQSASSETIDEKNEKETKKPKEVKIVQKPLPPLAQLPPVMNSEINLNVNLARNIELKPIEVKELTTYQSKQISQKVENEAFSQIEIKPYNYPIKGLQDFIRGQEQERPAVLGIVNAFEDSSQDLSKDKAGFSENKEKYPKAKYVQAGAVVPGILITEVNTDDINTGFSPVVMAEIVVGELKGSRLIGKVVRFPTSYTDLTDKVGVLFTKLSNPNNKKVYDVNVIAISEDTGRSGLSGDVNNHYVLRYGSSIVSSLLKGLGTAFANSGEDSKQTIVGNTIQTITEGANTTKNILKRGLGEVAVDLGDNINDFTEIPITIQLNQGSPVGLLFLNNF